jgi:hypothetical protein
LLKSAAVYCTCDRGSADRYGEKNRPSIRRHSNCIIKITFHSITIADTFASGLETIAEQFPILTWGGAIYGTRQGRRSFAM